MKKLLHPLANRGQGFVWPGFPVNAQYPTAKLSDDVERVRGLLRLDVQDSYYYLLGALNSLLAYAPIFDTWTDVESLRELVRYAPPETTWGNVTLVANQNGPAHMAWTPAAWPLSPRLELRCLDTARAELTDGTSTWEVPAMRNGNAPIFVAWPEEFRANGSLDTADAWTPGSVIDFYHHPAAYPYAAVERQLMELRETNQLLLAWGYAATWQAARSPVERVALVVAALIKQRNSHG